MTSTKRRGGRGDDGAGRRCEAVKLVVRTCIILHCQNLKSEQNWGHEVASLTLNGTNHTQQNRWRRTCLLEEMEDVRRRGRPSTPSGKPVQWCRLRAKSRVAWGRGQRRQWREGYNHRAITCKWQIGCTLAMTDPSIPSSFSRAAPDPLLISLAPTEHAPSYVSVRPGWLKSEQFSGLSVWQMGWQGPVYQRPPFRLVEQQPIRTAGPVIKTSVLGRWIQQIWGPETARSAKWTARNDMAWEGRD